MNYINGSYGYYVHRYKRFFADIWYGNKMIKAYCINTGKMRDINTFSRCIISDMVGGNNIFTHKLEAVVANGVFVGVNTHNPNKIAITLLQQLFPDDHFIPEVFFKKHRYRCDFASNNKVIEIKHVHWKIDNVALFPDTITIRGSKQLDVLNQLSKEGYVTYVIYIIQRSDVKYFSTANHIDSIYSNKSWDYRNSINYLAYTCDITLEGIEILNQVEIL